VLDPLAQALIGLIGKEAALIEGRSASLNPEAMIQIQNADLDVWEHHIEATIESDIEILKTDREALIVARRGQGLFKQRVMDIEHECRLTGVNNPIHLRGSHCKPWRDSNNAERLDGENGLLLTPSIDHLFDRGFISFENSGELILSPVSHALSLSRMGVPTDRVVHVGTFTEGQKHFLDYHRNSVLLRSSR
jgi:hypothetical protein